MCPKEYSGLGVEIAHSIDELLDSVDALRAQIPVCRDFAGAARQLLLSVDWQSAIAAKPPLVLFGSFNERMYLAECGARATYVPASFPGAIIRRRCGARELCT